jgi:hypothetical protein
MTREQQNPAPAGRSSSPSPSRTKDQTITSRNASTATFLAPAWVGSHPASSTNPLVLQIAQRQTSGFFCSVRAKLAVPGSLQAISSVPSEKTQHAETEAASVFEARVRKERQGGIENGMGGKVPDKISQKSVRRYGVLSVPAHFTSPGIIQFLG